MRQRVGQLRGERREAAVRRLWEGTQRGEGACWRGEEQDVRSLAGGLALAGGVVVGLGLAVFFFVGCDGGWEEEGFRGEVGAGVEGCTVQEEVALEGFGVWKLEESCEVR